MTCDVCDEAADIAIVEPATGDEVHTLCIYHLARLAIDRLAQRTEPDA